MPRPYRPAGLCNHSAHSAVIRPRRALRSRGQSKSAPAARQRPGAGTGGSAPMQSQRIAEASALSGSVRGLGVCDALRVELAAEQLPGLVEQLEAHSAALRDEIERRRAALMPRDLRGAAQLDEAENELRLIELIRTELPA